MCRVCQLRFFTDISEALRCIEAVPNQCYRNPLYNTIQVKYIWFVRKHNILRNISYIYFTQNTIPETWHTKNLLAKLQCTMNTAVKFTLSDRNERGSYFHYVKFTILILSFTLKDLGLRIFDVLWIVCRSICCTMYGLCSVHTVYCV